MLPSSTALFTALRRALAHRSFHNEQFGPDHLAEVFLPAHFRFFLRFERVRQNGWRKLDAAMPGMSAYVIARTAWLDHLFVGALHRGIPQIVILGAGYDTRPYRFASLDTNTTIYELDAPATQDRKRQCLKAARIPMPPTVRFAPIDFLAQSLSDALQAAGYRPQAETLFLWEGVSYYLDAEAVDKTLAFVSRGGNTLAFDYTIPLTDEAVRRCYGAAELRAAMRNYHKDEAFMFAIPEGQLEAFLAQRDMRVIEHLDTAAIEQAFLLDHRGARLGPVSGNFRFVQAQAC